MGKRAERERELLDPLTKEMQLPTHRKRNPKSSKSKRTSGGSGGGFGGKQAAAPVRTKEMQLHDLRVDTLKESGVCLVPNVLGADSSDRLYECVADELARAYAAVESDKSACLGRFNVPHETFDPLRGYLLLPLVDEKSASAGEGKDGPLVSALRELLTDDAPLASLFHTMCGGKDGSMHIRSPDLYDLVGLRTEAGASRQPIHSDTPYQKIPGLFCAFIALTDVRYEQGTTVFLPGTHTGSKGPRKAYDNARFDPEASDKMLSEIDSRYTLLKKGDAVVFNMNTLHAGTANYDVCDGGGQRLLFILTFRNVKAKEDLGHLPNLRLGYRDRGITLADMQAELNSDDPFAGDARDGLPFGDGILD